jgi:hypothetical protein
MTAAAAPTDVLVSLSHCGQAMKYRGSRIGWEGELEKSELRYACMACSATAVLSVKVPVGPPDGGGRSVQRAAADLMADDGRATAPHA